MIDLGADVVYHPLHETAPDNAAPAVGTLWLSHRAPYDWSAMLAFLEARAISGVEVVEGNTYRRTLRCEGHSGTVEVSHLKDRGCLVATVRFPSVQVLPAVVACLRRVFDLEAEIGAIGAHLSRDERLAPLIARRPGLRVPGGWDGFELGARAILGQQVTVKAARLLAGRLTAAFGEPFAGAVAGGDTNEKGLTHTFPRAERIAAADLASIGMPRARAAALRGLAAAAVADPELFQRKPSLADSIARFRALPGIGEWTAHYIALRALREPDAFPATDIALLRGASAPGGERLTAAALLARAEAWRPFRAYAAQHLWALDAERARERTALAPPARSVG